MTPEQIKANDKTYRDVLKKLQELYPEADLSFGYIGNLGSGPSGGRYEDLEWFYFTKVWDSNPGFYKNCHSFRVGRTDVKENTDANTLWNQLVAWLDTKVVPDYGTPCTRPAPFRSRNASGYGS